MSTSQDDLALASVSSLSDPVRGQLYDFVAHSREPVGRDEAAAAVGIGRAIAVYHLDKLVESGLLTASYRRRPGRGGPGAGRPAKFYARSGREFMVTVPPREYELAADLLAQAVAADHGGASRVALHDAARQFGVRAGAAHRAATGQGAEAAHRAATGEDAEAAHRAATHQDAEAAHRAATGEDAEAAHRAATGEGAEAAHRAATGEGAEAARCAATEGESAGASLRAVGDGSGGEAAPASDELGAQAGDGHRAVAAEGERARVAGANQGGAGDAARVGAVLRAHGFEPWPGEDGTVVLRNCPFHRLAERHREIVCGMNLALIEGLMAGLGTHGMRPELDPRPGHCCVVIRADGPSAEAARAGGSPAKTARTEAR